MTRLYAIDVGGSHVACAIVENDRVLAREGFAIVTGAALGATLPRIEAILLGLADQAGAAEGLTIAFPAIVDPGRGRVLATPAGKFEDAVDIDFSAWSAARLGVAMRIELDARMALLGERYAGALAGSDDAALLTLGTGIGTAAMIGGTLLRGRHFQAGCLGGHLSLGIDGAPCICGGVGCIEAEASTWALSRLAAAIGIADSALAREPALDFEAVFRLARTSDPAAIGLRDHCVALWSVAVVNLIHAYDPEVVLVTGGVLAAVDDILPPMREHVRRHSWTPWGQPRLTVGSLGADAALLGAVPLWELNA